MIRDLKNGFRIMSYALNKKSNIICIVLFAVIGLIFGFILPGMSIMGVYSGIASLMAVQMIQSVTVSGLVQSSPRNKELQTRISALVAVIMLLISNTVLLGVQMLGKTVLDYEEAEVANGILYGAGMYLIIMIYMAAAMKLYLPASIVFAIVFFIYYTATARENVLLNQTEVEQILSLEASVACSYAAIILGGILMYIIFRVTYRLPYSKMTWEAALKRAK